MADPKESKYENKSKTVFNFKGRFAKYANGLLKNDRNPRRFWFFDDIYRMYAFCALYGVLKGIKHMYDPSQDNADIEPVGFRWETANRATGIYRYDIIRKIVLLYNRADKQTLAEKIDAALRFDYPVDGINDNELIEKSRYSANSEIVDEYALGGIELFYQKISKMTTAESIIEFMTETEKEFTDLNDSIREEITI